MTREEANAVLCEICETNLATQFTNSLLMVCDNCYEVSNDKREGLT